MPYFDRSHDLSLELFLGLRHVVLDLFYGHLSASPLALEDLRWIAVAYLLLEHQSAKINYILLSIFPDLLNDKFLQVDQVLTFCWEDLYWSSTFLLLLCLNFRWFLSFRWVWSSKQNEVLGHRLFWRTVDYLWNLFFLTLKLNQIRSRGGSFWWFRLKLFLLFR